MPNKKIQAKKIQHKRQQYKELSSSQLIVLCDRTCFENILYEVNKNNKIDKNDQYLNNYYDYQELYDYIFKLHLILKNVDLSKYPNLKNTTNNNDVTPKIKIEYYGYIVDAIFSILKRKLNESLNAGLELMEDYFIDFILKLMNEDNLDSHKIQEIKNELTQQISSAYPEYFS